MKYQVEIIKKEKGFKKGTIKSLTLDNAQQLEKAGIGKILKAKPAKNNIDQLSKVVALQADEINELKKEVEILKSKG